VCFDLHSATQAVSRLHATVFGKSCVDSSKSALRKFQHTYLVGNLVSMFAQFFKISIPLVLRWTAPILIINDTLAFLVQSCFALLHYEKNSIQ
jgi:hypothetical protein